MLDKPCCLLGGSRVARSRSSEGGRCEDGRILGWEEEGYKSTLVSVMSRRYCQEDLPTEGDFALALPSKAGILEPWGVSELSNHNHPSLYTSEVAIDRKL